MRLSEKIKIFILKNNLFRPGDTVIIGISGGPDSVALTHILYTVRHELNVDIHLVHYDHRLRAGSAKDCAFVKSFARGLGLPLTVERRKGRRPAKKISLEEFARQKRLDFFRRTCKKIGTRTVALAHTKDDLAETVLMRILRGSGLQGLRGMLPKTSMPGLTIARPLLDVTKKDLLAYLRKHNLSYCQDPTNRSTQFFRNKIRLKLMPLLEKKYTPGITDTLCSLAATAGEDYTFLEQEGGRTFEKLTRAPRSSQKIQINLKALKKAHPAIQRTVIRRCLERVKGDTRRFTLKHMLEIEDLIRSRPPGSTVDLPAAIKVTTGKTFITFSPKQ